MNNWESYIIDRLNKDAEKLAMMKLAGLYDYPSNLVIKRAAITEKDLENWDDLSTQEKNQIIQALAPHEFRQLPGDRLGYGWEGSAYKAISPDFGLLNDGEQFNAVIKKFYGFEGEKPRLQARYEIAKENPEMEFLQKKFRDPKLKKLLEAGNMYEAAKLYRKMQGGAWRHSTKKHDIMANEENNIIMAKIIKDAFKPSYETLADGHRSRNKEIGAIVMEALDRTEPGGISEQEFKELNKSLAKRIDKIHRGKLPGYGTNLEGDPNGLLGRSMLFRPVVKDINGNLYLLKDNHNAYTAEDAHDIANYWQHNVGTDANNNLKIFDFAEKPI